jgi:hypothetical protein
MELPRTGTGGMEGSDRTAERALERR